MAKAFLFKELIEHETAAAGMISINSAKRTGGQNLTTQFSACREAQIWQTAVQLGITNSPGRIENLFAWPKIKVEF